MSQNTMLLRANWNRTVRELVMKAVEIVLKPRVPVQYTQMSSNSFLQLQIPEMPTIRKYIHSLIPERGAFAVVLDVSRYGVQNAVLLERWEFTYLPEVVELVETGPMTFYEHASVVIRAVSSLALILPAAVTYRNRLNYYLTPPKEDMVQWPKDVAVTSISPFAVCSWFGQVSIKVSYRNEMPSMESSEGPDWPSSVHLSSSESPHADRRPHLQSSSGNLAVLSAKCAIFDAGYTPLSVSFSDDQDMYLSDTEPEDLELLIEYEEGEQTPANSAMFRRVCKDAQGLKLFTGKETASLRRYLEEVKEKFEMVLTKKKSIVWHAIENGGK